MQSTLVGENVGRLRRIMGLTLAELGDRTELSAATVSRVERGRHGVDMEQVSRLATTLRCTPEWLLGGQPQLSRRPWLRAYSDAAKKDEDRWLATCELVADLESRLRLQRLPEAIPDASDADLADPLAIEEAAVQTREAAGLGRDEPVASTIRAAERLGVAVIPMDDELGRHLGMSTTVQMKPIMAIARSSVDVPGDRQRFTVSHELGHLVLHRDQPPPETTEQARELERQAHRFAGAFLIPGDCLAEEVAGRHLTLSVLEEIKAGWGISIRALVSRCKDVGLANESKARSLFKQISARGWNTGEPIDVPGERAVWLDQALRRVADGGSEPVLAGAEAVGLRRSYIDALLGWEEPRGATLLQFPRRP